MESVSIPLHEGWNLMSFDVMPQDPSIASAFQSIEGLYTEVRSYDGEMTIYRPDLPLETNTLQTVDAYHGYWINMTSDGVLTITGTPIEPGTAIPLMAGNNLVSYWPSSSLPVEEALASIDGLYTEVHGYADQALSYYSSLPPELNSLKTMEPGHGYWINMTEPGLLIYPGPLEEGPTPTPPTTPTAEPTPPPPTATPTPTVNAGADSSISNSYAHTHSYPHPDTHASGRGDHIRIHTTTRALESHLLQRDARGPHHHLRLPSHRGALHRGEEPRWRHA